MSEIQQYNEIGNTNDTNKYDELVNFLSHPESEQIIKDYQPKLDKQNYKTTDYLDKNINNTRNNVNININLGYSFIERKREEVQIDKFNGFEGDLSNIKDYKATNEINNFRELEIIEEKHDNLKEHYRNSKSPERSEILDDLFDLYMQGRLLKSGSDDFDDFKYRELSEPEINLMDSIKNQRTQADIASIDEISVLLGLANVDQTIVSPLDILKDKYQNSSEKDKLELGIIMSRYMNDYGYDDNGTGTPGDVSSEEIWASYREGGVAGVCRHHHSEVAKFLKSVGFETGILTTNSGGGHVVTWGKKQDGSFFMIDYGSLYEGKDPKELKAKYLASEGAINLKEWIADENGKVIGIIQTDLEKLFESTTSSIGTGNSLDYSKDLSNNGINIVDGHDINLNLDGELSTNIDYKYGNGNIEGGVFFNQVNNLDYANYLSYGIYGSGKIGSKENTFGELGAGIKLSENTFDWGNNKERILRVGGLSLQYSKKLYNNGTTEIGIGGVIQGQTMQDMKNAKEYGNNGIEDQTRNFGTSLDIKHKIAPNLEGNINLGYGADVGFENIRSADKFKLFDKKSIDLGLNYKKEDGDKIEGNVSYETGLGYEKIGGNINLKSGNLGVEAGYEQVDNSKNPFLLSEAKKSIGIQYNVTDTLVINTGYENTDNGLSSDDKYNIGLNYKF